MKFYLTFILTILLYCNSNLFGTNELTNSQNYSIKCDPRLRNYLAKIEKLPEAVSLIRSIQKEGAIQLAINNSSFNQFGAYWDPDSRMICVACSKTSNEGQVIGSILFELHNAAVNRQFEILNQLAFYKKINKAAFVESMEYLEYTNSLKAAKIAESGIRQGIFPVSARLPTYSNFKEHFSAQKQSGHSAWFSRNYDSISGQFN